MLPRRNGKVRVRTLSVDLADIAHDADLHPNTVRAVVRKEGARMFRTGIVTYTASSYQASGSGAFGRQSNHRAVYMPATVDLERL